MTSYYPWVDFILEPHSSSTVVLELLIQSSIEAPILVSRYKHDTKRIERYHYKRNRKFFPLLLAILSILICISIMPVQSRSGEILICQVNPHCADPRQGCGDYDYDDGALLTLESVIQSKTSHTAIFKGVRDPVSSDLSTCTFIFITGKYPEFFTPEERARLKEYIEKGGSIFGEDCDHHFLTGFDTSFREEMRLILGSSPRVLPASHPVFSSYYTLTGTPPTGWWDQPLEGIDIGGRTAVMYSRNDYGDCWDGHPECFAGENADKLGINIATYFLQNRQAVTISPSPTTPPITSRTASPTASPTTIQSISHVVDVNGEETILPLYGILGILGVIGFLAVSGVSKYFARRQEPETRTVTSTPMIETSVPIKATQANTRTIDHDVFISYASSDKPVADAICNTLESRRIRCWIAPRDILPGSNFQAAIIDAIDTTMIMVLVFSSQSNNSPHVLSEVTEAMSMGVIIIPFRIEDVLPSKAMKYLISVPHWLDAMTPPLEKHIDELATTIEVILNQKKGNSEK